MLSKYKILQLILSVSILTLLSQVVYAHGMSEADKLAIIEGRQPALHVAWRHTHVVRL